MKNHAWVKCVKCGMWYCPKCFNEWKDRYPDVSANARKNGIKCKHEVKG
uniref:Uncharacterized protein n=1 Tax=viral metagenome TaxID=1070528 RepID=A0A6M3J4X4_9ZZZZ